MPNRRSLAPRKPAQHAPALVQWDLPNGVRALHRPSTTTRLVHVAVILNVGSRDEGPTQHGIAHLLEHMAFKGTTHRKAFHVLSRIDSVGGELNAYTTKEKITYYATVTAEHLPRALELLADITFRPTFPAHELEKERTVIADEIDSYRDDPEEAIFEDFDQHLFPQHPLGHPILGTRASLAGLDRNALQQFYANLLAPGRIAVSVAGNATPRRVQTLVAKFFGAHTLAGSPVARSAPTQTLPAAATVGKPIAQAHYMLGGYAPAFTHADHPALGLLLHYLGGPSMNSRLSLAIRERYGLTYNIQTFHQPYTDSGLWGVYAGMEPASLPRVKRLIAKELEVLARTPLTPTAFHRIQQQFLGSLVIAYESLFHQMIAQGKELLDLDRWYTLDDVIATYQALTPADIQRVAAAYFHPATLTSLTYQPH